MSIQTADFLALLRALLDQKASGRARASDDATDWVNGYSDRQAETLVAVLLWLAEHESDQNALEAELHAATEIVENRDVDPRILREARALDPSKITIATSEYYNYLISLAKAS
ncbi:hypothetical protein [Nocardia iowensis]|uniref:Uncharacterized protein n=1 Tax=Nocardia iowensis TaxID=204891 RepID=A0ABX8RYH8_NOCIO|nr:hypothetical protein [Nocardia iowensis]QXN94720.1 hypothetical protein KV110_17710 [Nocardia iowensis]